MEVVLVNPRKIRPGTIYEIGKHRRHIRHHEIENSRSVHHEIIRCPLVSFGICRHNRRLRRTGLTEPARRNLERHRTRSVKADIGKDITRPFTVLDNGDCSGVANERITVAVLR